MPKHSASSFFILSWLIIEFSNSLKPRCFYPAQTACRCRSRENPVVLAKVTDEFEVLPETCVMQHAPSVAAYRENTSGLNVVMPVEDKAMRMIGYRAAIDHGLPVILASGFQPIQFEQPIGGRVKTQITHAWRELRIGYVQRTAFDQPRVCKPMTMRQPQKVVPVQRAAQAFPVQHGIIAYRIRHSAVGIDIREIEFAARFEQAMHFAQYRIF